MVDVIIWEKFFSVGEELSKHDEEEYIRSAIGRYYYSLFGMARYYLIYIKGEEEFKSRQNIHIKVMNRLLYSKDYNEQFVGEVLSSFRQYRNIADYDLDFNSNRDMRICLKEAKQGLDTIKFLINNPYF